MSQLVPIKDSSIWLFYSFSIISVFSLSKFTSIISLTFIFKCHLSFFLSHEPHSALKTKDTEEKVKHKTSLLGNLNTEIKN